MDKARPPTECAWNMDMTKPSDASVKAWSAQAISGSSGTADIHLF